MTELEMMVGRDEQILWRGRPDKKCFVLESIFNPLLPFALVWLLFDGAFIGMMFFTDAVEGFGMGIIGIIAFFALHLMPVWIYLAGLIGIGLKYRRIEYIVTDKGIYVSGGLFSYSCEMKPFTDLSHINIHRGIFDQWIGVGDVISQCHHTGSTSSSHGHSHSGSGISICNIREYQKVFNLIRDLQTDIYSDTMYPNDLRPEANHGYKTKYTPGEKSLDDYPDFNNNRFN